MLKLYFNCYIIGEGYRMKCFDCETGILEEINGSGIQKALKSVFTNTGALLFLGTVENCRFGCVRQIVTENLDENGRKCFYNIGFESEEGKDTEADRIMLFALKHYRVFAKAVRNIVYYEGMDYKVREASVQKLREAAEHMMPGKMPACVVVPEVSMDYFLKNTQFPFEKDQIKVIGKERLTEDGEESKFFFYCSAPTAGFVLKQVDPKTGMEVASGKEAMEEMDPDVSSVFMRGGTKLALFHTKTGICFVAKDVRSGKQDQFGRTKYINIAFEGGSGPLKKQVMALAAWAFCDYPAFAEKLTDCVKVYDGPKLYEVRKEELHQLFKMCRELPAADTTDKNKAQWEEIVQPVSGKKFVYLITEVSFSYFCRMTKMEVKEKDIQILKNSGEFDEKIKKKTEESDTTEKCTHQDKAQREEDRIALLEVRGFWAVLGVVAAAVIAGAMKFFF